MNNVLTVPSRLETYRSAAAKKKAHGDELIAESGLIGEYGSSTWTASLIRKYLRPYSLGPGPVKWGRARNRYRRADVKAAWLRVPPAIRREREAVIQGYYSTSSVEKYLAHEAKQRALNDIWESAAEAVDISFDPFPQRLDWMDTVRRRFEANDLTREQIAAVERIPRWTWEIGKVWCDEGINASGQLRMGSCKSAARRELALDLRPDQL